MAAVKALLIAGLFTIVLFMLIVWIIPIMTFVVIFGLVASVAYVIFKESSKPDRPPH